MGDGGVVDKYMSIGIAGFRLDVADELSDEFLERLKRASVRPRSASVLWGEVWEDASCKIAYGKRKAYFHGSELDGVMNYPLRRGIIEFFTRKGCAALKYAINGVGLNCPKRIADYQLNFLGTHDTERILTALSGFGGEGLSTEEKMRYKMPREVYEKATRLLRVAYLTLIVMPGIPSIFYGDEAGVEGFGDPYCRKQFPWGREDESLVRYYADAGAFRRSEEILAEGELKLHLIDDETIVLSRDKGEASILLFVNNSENRKLKITVNEAQLVFKASEGRIDRTLSRESIELLAGDGVLLKIKTSGNKNRELTVTRA